MVRLPCRLLALVVLWMLVAVPVVSAQTGQAELRGTVLDEQGGVLPGATITARHVETGATRTVVSFANGAFRMPALPVGKYTVEVELQGFAKLVQEGIILAVGQTADMTFRLRLPTVAETITVTGESPLVETRTSDISGRIGAQQIASLPIVNRDWLALVALAPGARGTLGSVVSGASGSDMAKYQVDGVDVTNQCCGGTYMTYSQENLAEFQVMTNRFDAEYGRVGGTVINAVTKSGTNIYRGTFLGFFRNVKFESWNQLMRDLQARKVFPAEKPYFNQRQIAVTFGGPVVKDRMHFFGTFERQLREEKQAVSTNIAKFDGVFPTSTTRTLYTVRLDWQLGQNHRLFVRSSKNDRTYNETGFGSTSLPSTGYSWPSLNNDLSIGETWVISDHAVHEFRVGFMRDIDRLTSTVEMTQYSFPSLTIGSATNSPQHWGEFNLEAKNSFSYFVPDWHGQHALRTGFQYFRPRFYGALPDKSFGRFSFSKDPPNWDGITPDGRVTSMAGWPAPNRYTDILGDFTYDVVNPTLGAFFQDNWTTGRRLTLNLGVRYDIELGVKNPDLKNPIDPRERSYDADNIQPRLGFAYDVRGDGKTVIRGGWGIYYDKVMLNISGNELRLANKKSVNINIINPNLADPLQGRGYEYWRDYLVTSTIVIANDYKTPQERQFSIGVAREVRRDYAFQVDFVHIKGKNEPRARDINLYSSKDFPQNFANIPAGMVLPANPSLFGRPNPSWGVITQYETTAGSEYNGLQTGLTKRLSHRFQFQATYTLSKTWNDHEGNRFAGVNNPFNLADEWSLAGADQRHRLVANCIVMLPWDLRASAIYFLGSPRTQSPSTSYDPYGVGGGRWLDQTGFDAKKNFIGTGQTLVRDSLRTPKWDTKLDVSLAKTLRLRDRYSVQGIFEVYNVTNRSNIASVGTNIKSASYLLPNWSSGDTYMPRMFQLAFRVGF